MTNSRVVGIPNEVISGKKSSAKCGLGDWRADKQLLVFVGAEIYSEDLLESNEPRLHAVRCLLEYLTAIKKEVDIEKQLCDLLFKVVKQHEIEVDVEEN